jgi:hypothetical protein
MKRPGLTTRVFSYSDSSGARRIRRCDDITAIRWSKSSAAAPRSTGNQLGFLRATLEMKRPGLNTRVFSYSDNSGASSIRRFDDIKAIRWSKSSAAAPRSTGNQLGFLLAIRNLKRPGLNTRVFLIRIAAVQTTFEGAMTSRPSDGQNRRRRRRGPRETSSVFFKRHAK